MLNLAAKQTSGAHPYFVPVEHTRRAPRHPFELTDKRLTGYERGQRRGVYVGTRVRQLFRLLARHSRSGLLRLAVDVVAAHEAGTVASRNVPLSAPPDQQRQHKR